MVEGKGGREREILAHMEKHSETYLSSNHLRLKIKKKRLGTTTDKTNFVSFP